MYINTSCTVYHGSRKQRFFVPACFWDENQGQNITKSGIQTADSTLIMIPLSECPKGFRVAKQDIVVKCECLFEFDITSQQMISAGMKELRENYSFVTVNASDKKDFGSEAMKHYELSCK